MIFERKFYLGINENLLEEERNRMRSEYEAEMAEMRNKMEREKQTKAQMQIEIEAMKQEYEDKLKALETRAKTANALSRQHRYVVTSILTYRVY